jgi:hypothetical protein
LQDINHQDNRVQPEDGIQFLWLSSFCMRYQRIKLFYEDCAAADAHEAAAAIVSIDLDDSESEDGDSKKKDNKAASPPLRLPSKSFAWTKSPTFVNMDLWSFQYVIKSCQVSDVPMGVCVLYVCNETGK